MIRTLIISTGSARKFHALRWTRGFSPSPRQFYDILVEVRSGAFHSSNTPAWISAPYSPIVLHTVDQTVLGRDCGRPCSTLRAHTIVFNAFIFRHPYPNALLTRLPVFRNTRMHGHPCGGFRADRKLLYGHSPRGIPRPARSTSVL